MIGKKSYQLLRSMGVSTIKTLSMIPPEMMIQVMGKNGLVILKKANGIDNTPVMQYSENKSISTEKTFDKDTIDIVRLNNLLVSMVEKIAFEFVLDLDLNLDLFINFYTSFVESILTSVERCLYQVKYNPTDNAINATNR